MKYMFLLFDVEEDWEPTEEEMEPWNRLPEEAAKLGAREVGGEALHPSRTATVVSVRDGKTIITDGPFIETKEQIGGFLIYECESMEIALKVAELIPIWTYRSESGHVEIRPVMDVGA